MVKVTRTQTSPTSLSKQSNDCYRAPDVVDQLYKDFHGKCYICERDEVQSPEVEHLVAHGGNSALKYDWNNLFFSCSHCNSVKNQKKYSKDVVDCCFKDPEKIIEHSFVNNHVKVVPLNTTLESTITAELITECFENVNTGIRTLERAVLIKSLNSTMNVFYKTLIEYKSNPSQEIYDELSAMLSRTYKFAGFTRAYVRANLTSYPTLATLV